MSDGSDDSVGSWWSSWIEKAKQTSSAALSVVKRDLTEFVETVRSDASEAISTTTEALKDKMKVGNPKEKAEGAMDLKSDVKSKGSATSLCMMETMSTSRSEAELNSIKNDISTYCSEPDLADFSQWSSDFNLDLCTKEISELLVSNDKVRALQTKLVPSTVSYKAFWMRYFYRVSQWKREQERRARLMERAQQSSDTDGKDLDWEDEDDSKEIASKRVDCQSEEDTGKEVCDNKEGRSRSNSGSVTELDVVSKSSGTASPVSTSNSSESFVTLPLPANSGSGSGSGSGSVTCNEARVEGEERASGESELCKIDLGPLEGKGDFVVVKDEDNRNDEGEDEWDSWDS